MTKSMTKTLRLLEQINICADTPYPCDKTPGKYKGSNSSSLTYVTAGTRIILTSKEGTRTEWAPSLYQSCMNLEHKEIRTLSITLCNNKLSFQTRYDCCTVNPEETKIELFAWTPSQKKANCLACTNCGRCSW